jgi:hypothetical protein
MPVPQVSPQALFNEAERHKSWESLEACLTNLLTTGQVLDYKKFDDHVEVALDGTNKPVKLPIRFPAKSAVPAGEFEEEKKPEPPVVKTAPKAAQKPVKAAGKAVQAPVGVVALVGLRTESYDAHLRRLLKHVLYERNVHQRDLDAEVEKTMQGWFRSLK